MRYLMILFLLIPLFGCSSQTTDTALTPPVVGTEDSVSNELTSPEVSTDEAPSTSGKTFELTPTNTKLQFTGTHKVPPPDPKARVGTFSDFSGVAVVEDDDLRSINLEIKVASIQTENEKLTNHLKAPDFFDAREYPTATFEATRIARNEEGIHEITGNLTMLKTTKEVSFPATVGMQNGDLQLSAKLKINRTEFGMTDHTDGVNEEVAIEISVGQQSE